MKLEDEKASLRMNSLRLQPSLVAQAEEVAERLGVPRAQVLRWALAAGLPLVAQGKIPLVEATCPAPPP